MRTICKIKHIVDEKEDGLDYHVLTCVMIGGKVEKYVCFFSIFWIRDRIGKFINMDTFSQTDSRSKVNKEHRNLNILYSILPATGIDIFRARKKYGKD